jgi:pimeloyl-ACP methyl ester carboxylesterase
MILDVHGHPAHLHSAPAAIDAARTTIVLIHGALNDHTVWQPLAAALAATGQNVLAVDLPGHGASAGPALPSVEALADWLLAVLDAAAVGPALLAGHSMGSLVALEAAQRAPQRVRALALLGTAWPMRVSAALLASALDDDAAAIEMVTGWSHAHPDVLAARGAGDLPAATRALMQRVARSGPAHLLHTDLNACNTYLQGADAAARIGCPTLFIVGSRDQMTPARAARALAAQMAGARSVEVDAGHAMMAEQPDAVGAALADFARGAVSAPPD